MRGGQPMELEAFAPAKVNLSLEVSEQVEGGRHLVRTVMQALSLGDTLRAECVPCEGDPAVSISMHALHGMGEHEIALEDNLIYRAICEFHARIGKPLAHRIAIDVEKRVPEQSGLGGGSSDCASAIAMMARLHGLDPAGPEAVDTARALGSDIAFFLRGACCELGGYGDVLNEVLAPPALDMVVARPAEGCPTGRVYGVFDGLCAAGRPNSNQTHDALLALLREARGGAAPGEVAALVGNSLQEAAFEVEPAVRRVYDALLAEEGVLAAMVSGSGSCCFAICDGAGAAERVAAGMAALGYWSRACKTLQDRDGAQ